jgi:hypothetical protein
VSTLPSRLQVNQQLKAGDKVGSPDGRFIFTFQTDGNLVLYQGATALWSSKTNGIAVSYLIMQDDGNLVLYSADKKAKWDSHTSGHKGAYFAVQDDGNAVVLSSDGKPLWATNTGSS